MRFTQDNIVVNVEPDVRDTLVAVRYEIENRADAPLFLFNILHGNFRDGLYPIDPLGYYAEVRDHRLVLSRKMASPPEDRDVEIQNVPFVTRVAPGERFGETIQVAAPVRLRSAYDNPARQRAPVRESQMAAILELGYFFAKPGTDQLAKLYQTDHGAYPGFMPFTQASQRLIRSPQWGPVRVLV